VTLPEKQVYHMGPLLRVQWNHPREPEHERKGSLWLERGVLERLRVGLIPVTPPVPLQADAGPCWVWTGPVDAEGRGMVYNQEQAWHIHRLLYTIQHGPLSPRVHLHSACGNTRCCNPLHQQPIERGPIERPASHLVAGRYPRCKNGHALSPENVYVFEGKPMCRDCRAAAQARYRRRSSSASRSNGTPPVTAW
jgi:hypothetical protein